MSQDIDYSQMDITELQDLLIRGQNDVESVKILDAMRAKSPPQQEGGATAHCDKLLDSMREKGTPRDTGAIGGSCGASPTLDAGIEEARRVWQETVSRGDFGANK